MALLAVSSACAAADDGVVREVTKDTFTVKNARGEVIKLQVGEKLLKDEEDDTRGGFKDKFADLKKDHHVFFQYYKKGDTLICTAIKIVGVLQLGLVQEVTKDTFTIKTDKGDVQTFQVGEKLLKDQPDEARGSLTDKFADLKKDHRVRFEYHKKGDTLICTAIKIEKKE